jgi:hypothetical protein
VLLSLEEAIGLLQKWREESAALVILGQNTFRWGLRNIHEGGVDWNVALRGQVLEVSGSSEASSSTAWTVRFEGTTGNLSLSLENCMFSYDENREGPPFLQGEARIEDASCLNIFFPSNETFVVYQLRG